MPEGMVELAIDPHAYAVFPHRGNLTGLPETIMEVFDVWLPQSGYQLVDEIYFEFYEDNFQPGSLDSVLFIFVPVVEAKSV